MNTNRENGMECILAHNMEKLTLGVIFHGFLYLILYASFLLS